MTQFTNSMKKLFQAPLFCAGALMLCASVSQAAVVITIDVSNPSNVVFSATVETSSRDESSVGNISGVSLMDFFNANTSGSSGFTGSLAVVGVQAFDFYDTLDAGNTMAPGPGRDLNLSAFVAGNMTFSMASPAFEGSSEIDFSSVASFLPAPGTVGDVRPGLGLTLTDSIGTFQVIPEPSSGLLLLAGVAGALGLRCRHDSPSKRP